MEVEVVMLSTEVMLFLDLMCSGLEEEEEELVLSCFKDEKEQDPVFFEACKSRCLGFPEEQNQQDSSQRERTRFSYLSTESTEKMGKGIRVEYTVYD